MTLANSPRDNWTAIIIGMLVYLMLSILCSCGTHKVSVVERVSHDTLTIVKKDTVDRYRERLVRDSVWEQHLFFNVLDSMGNTIKEKEIHYIYKERETKDSTDYYKSRFDSLMKARVDSIPVVVEIEKPLTKWQRFKQDSFEVFFIMCFFIIVLVVKKLMNGGKSQ